MRNDKKSIAIRRIKKLLNLALQTYYSKPSLAKRYMYILWKIKQKTNVKLPKTIKYKFCKKCFTPWIPSKTLRIRIRKGWIVYTCLNCGRIYKIKKVK